MANVWNRSQAKAYLSNCDRARQAVENMLVLIEERQCECRHCDTMLSGLRHTIALIRSSASMVRDQLRADVMLARHKVTV